MRDYKFFRDSNDDDGKLREERRKFEEKIEEQLLATQFNTNSKPSYMPYKKGGKNLINTLLISAFILGIIAFGGWYFANQQYSTMSTHNVDMIHNAIQFSVDSYYQEYRTFPVDMYGNIDYNLLQNRGYLNLNIEEYKSMFRFDNQYKVIRIE